ncbi:Hint domain-containing protein [Donghicola sp. XS_ASV15]|uniref:Hint domain-containing protein n=1 Tax=Donghicola sp. XS_ASV15 TaxID=3241295 RepID=UPI003516C674
MANTFNAIYLGQYDVIDPTEGNQDAENGSALVGLSVGAEGDPLLNSFVSISPANDPHEEYDQDNNLHNDQFYVDGQFLLTFDSIAQYNATVIFVDGTSLMIPVAIFQDTEGHTFWAPYSTPNTIQDQLEMAGIRSISLDAYVTGTWAGMASTRETWNYAMCFTSGTMIETADGPCPVESLKPGDRVQTADHGLQALRWIGSREVVATGALAPVRFETGVLGNTRPITLSQQHRVLLSGWEVALTCGMDEGLAAAKHLVNGREITLQHGGNVTYFHLLFDHHEIVFAEGMPSESFHPGDKAWRLLTPDAKREMLALFPNLMAQGLSSFGPVVRPLLRAHEARLVMERRASSMTSSGFSASPSWKGQDFALAS